MKINLSKIPKNRYCGKNTIRSSSVTAMATMATNKIVCAITIAAFNVAGLSSSASIFLSCVSSDFFN